MTIRIDSTVLTEQDNKTRMGLTIHNLSDTDLDNWSLHFTFGRFILSDSCRSSEQEEIKIEQIGSYCILNPIKTKRLKANSHFYTEIDVQTVPFRFYADGIVEAAIRYTPPHSDGLASIAQLIKAEVPPLGLLSSFVKRAKLPHVNEAELALIPLPNKLERLEGSFAFESLSISASELGLDAANWLCQEMENRHPVRCHFDQFISPSVQFHTQPELAEQAYRLTVNSEQILVESSSQQGFIYACATLLQLIKQEEKFYSVPCIRIEDQPTYRYRGMMLDCARHFHPVSKVKQIINQLALYKYNYFHWHLTDDEGWRFEIKALPQLTHIGGWRGVDQPIQPQFSFLTEKHGGYYTQEEIKTVIAFAKQRGITVIPEIDIPAHCRAAILSLPDQLIEPGDTSVYRSIQNYTDNVLNPALPGTYQFLDSVIDEICALFPSPYVHIGADEVPDGVWEKSPLCQQLMKKEGYLHPHELQGHLLRYVEQRLHSKGKRMLGWEEAQHGNKVSKDTVIYSWRSEQAAIECATKCFDVVLQPAQTTYLDMAQDFAPTEPGVCWENVLPLEKVYRYQPLADIPAQSPLHKKVWGSNVHFGANLLPTQIKSTICSIRVCLQ